MAELRYLKDADGNIIYPVTHADAIIGNINNNDNNDNNKYQTMSDANLSTENKTVVGAINEIHQNVNNGKQLIALAIGEPLNAEDTFSAMSDDINGLLSTFKTNMMNNGITVNSGDKFKQLIDKLINDNTNKEELSYLLNAPDYYNEEFYNDLKTQSTHIEGYNYPVVSLKDTVNNGVISFDMTGSSSSGYTGTNCVLSVFTNEKKIDLTNVTSIKIVAKRTSSNAVISFGIFSQFVNVGYPGHPDFTKYITIATTDSYIEYTLDTTEVIGEHHIGITVTTTNLSSQRKAYVYVQSIMLTSIGKKDALRDSLVSILQDEGVEVTEEDDMASLITKVDEEFDRKNANSNSGLDIISATELPATGKENQICVITDNPVNNFIVTPNSNDVSSDLDIITCYIGNSSSMDTNLGALCTIQNNNITIKYYFNEVCQGSNRLDSYIYQNSQWSTLTVRSIFFIKNNYYVNESVSGTISTGTNVSIDSTSGITLKTTYSSSSAGRSFPGTAFSNRINFSSLDKMIIKAYSSRSSVNLHFYACNKNSCVTYNNVSTVTSSLDVKYTSTISSVTTSTTPQEYTIDISSWQGDYYLGMCAESTSNIGYACNVYISHIEFF